jgi:hypothetical protein
MLGLKKPNTTGFNMLVCMWKPCQPFAIKLDLKVQTIYWCKPLIDQVYCCALREKEK